MKWVLNSTGVRWRSPLIAHRSSRAQTRRSLALRASLVRQVACSLHTVFQGLVERVHEEVGVDRRGSFPRRRRRGACRTCATSASPARPP
jgi:hypothetical protein